MSTDDVEPFLKAIFRNTGNGYVAIVKVPISDQRPDWGKNRTLYFPVANGVPEIPNYGMFDTESEWYLCPALMKDQGRKKDSVKESAVLWIDFDKAVDLSTLVPEPSIVVQSSPGRCHVYALLDEALPPGELEQYNRKLAYTYDADISGFDSTQLLRLPAGLNAKRDPHHVVALEKLDDSSTYSINEFDYLEEVNIVNTSEYKASAMPEDISEDREAIVEKYGEKMSRRLWDILERRQDTGSKRSGALWSIYSELFELGMSQEEAFVLIRNTPNDKFSRLGDDRLWADIDRGFSNIRFKKSEDIKTQLKDIDHEKGLLGKEKANRQGTLIADDMELRGKLFMTEAGDAFYLEYGDDANKLFTVDQKDSDFGMMMFSRYDVNPASHDAAMVIEVVRIRCRTHDYQQVFSVAHYDRDKNVCYVNRFDNNYYRVAVEGIHLHKNGEDGVFFLNPINAKPWEYLADDFSGTWGSMIFSSLNAASDQPKAVIDHIVKTWVLSVFFGKIVPVKPILLFYGDPGSGKTATLNAVAQTVLGLTQWSQCFPDKVEDFYLQTSQNDFMFYDNVESLKSWMRDGLDVASTGGTVSSRQMYKKTELVTFSVSCALALTTSEPKFLRYADVLERTIPIHVVRWDGNKGMQDIIDGIFSKRNALMSEMLNEVQKCLHVIASPKYAEIRSYSYQDRLSDFHAFMRVTCEASGREFDEHFDFVTASRTQDMREHNVIVRCVENWLDDPSRYGQSFTSKFLYDRWAMGPEGPAFRRQFKSSRALGILLSHKTFALDMAKLGLECTIVTKSTGNEYVFTGSMDTSRSIT